MMHKRRKWMVAVLPENNDGIQDLAHKLTSTTWVCCQAFRCGKYIFANDSTSEDGAQEYAIVVADDPIPTPKEPEFNHLPDHWRQIESVTFGWMSEVSAREFLNNLYAGKIDDYHYGIVPAAQFETEQAHGRCRHCE